MGFLGRTDVSNRVCLLALREQGEAGLDLVAEVEDVVDEAADQDQLHVIDLCPCNLLHQRLYLQSI